MLSKIFSRDFLRYARFELWGMHAPYERKYYSRAFFCLGWFFGAYLFNSFVGLPSLFYQSLNAIGLLIFFVSLASYMKARRKDKPKESSTR